MLQYFSAFSTTIREDCAISCQQVEGCVLYSMKKVQSTLGVTGWECKLSRTPDVRYVIHGQTIYRRVTPGIVIITSIKSVC